MSQGEIVFVDEKRLSRIRNIDKDIKIQERIVLQGITGVNEPIRLKMMIVKNAYCANSLNYLSMHANINNNVLLGLFNSRLMNFVFSKFSTNSNVNGYEVDNLPICIRQGYNSVITFFVDIVLRLKKNSIDTIFFESLIDGLVYELYLPDEIKAADAELLKHLTNLPELRDDWSKEKKLEVIKKVFKELSDPLHPVAIAMEKMKTVPEVRIIEGLDK